ncbi:MAG: putative acylesterase/phospholipase RssA [Myxococcota bacterium]|jgi:predicted acylesterase/phospholipase RssA
MVLQHDVELGVPVRRLRVPAAWGLRVLWPRDRAEAGRLVDALAARGGEDDTVVVSCGGDGPPAGPVIDRATCTVVVRWAHDATSRVAAQRHRYRVEVVRCEAGVDVPLALHRSAVRMLGDAATVDRFWASADIDVLVDRRRHIGRFAGRLERVITGRTVGVALGGGGALGFAHVALLRALHEADIPVDVVSGVSFGAVVGALYAAGGLELLDRLIAERRLVHWLVSTCVVSTRPFSRWIERRTAGVFLETTEIPFFPVALDVWTGREIVVTRGGIADGVRASSSFPGVFPAVSRGMARLVDGGIINNVPVSVAWDAGAHFIIASNIIPRFPHGRSGWVGRGVGPLGRLDDVMRSVFLLMSQAGRDRATLADYVFELDIQGFNIYEIRRGLEIHDVALEQARAEVETIRAAWG